MAESKKAARLSGSDVHVAATPQKPKKDMFGVGNRQSKAPNNTVTAYFPPRDVATPPRRQAKPSPFDIDENVVPSTPETRRGLFAGLKGSTSQQPQAPPRSRLVGDEDTIFATPQKKRDTSGSGAGAGDSIYEALGWDDEEEEE